MNLSKIALAALFAAAALPASAATFDFYKLGRGAGDFLPSDGIACTGGDLCSSNVDGGVRNGDLTFANGGITVHAAGSYFGQTAASVQDHESAYTSTIGAGLGVYHLSGNSSDDNITLGEVLTLTFDRVVTLTGLGLRAEGHTSTFASGSTFLFNGVSTNLAGQISGLNATGSVFTFAYGGAHADQFYLSGATAVAAVPEPETYALMLAGLGVLGFVARRRRAD